MLKDNQKTLKKLINLKRGVKKALVVGLVAAGSLKMNAKPAEQNIKDADEAKKEVALPKKSKQIALDKYAYQVDTVNVVDNYAAFTKDVNGITVFYVKGNDAHNAVAKSKYAYIHERKHFENNQLVKDCKNLTVLQSYLLSFYDEMSASMAEILSFKQDYLDAKDKEAFKAENAAFIASKPTIQECLSIIEDKQDMKESAKLDKLFSVVCQGWLRDMRGIYANNFQKQLTRYIYDSSYEQLKKSANSEDFNKAVKAYFTYGKDNFSLLVPNVEGADIDACKHCDNLLEQGAHKLFINDDVFELFTLCPQENLSKEQQFKLMQHRYVAKVWSGSDINKLKAQGLLPVIFSKFDLSVAQTIISDEHAPNNALYEKCVKEVYKDIKGCEEYSVEQLDKFVHEWDNSRNMPLRQNFMSSSCYAPDIKNIVQNKRAAPVECQTYKTHSDSNKVSNIQIREDLTKKDKEILTFNRNAKLHSR